MTREEILNRVFHNAGVDMGKEVGTVSSPSPSDLYPYSMPRPIDNSAYGISAPERVVPGSAEWYGHSGAGGGLGGLILPAMASALGGGLPDAAVNADALAVPEEAYAYNAASNAAQQANTQAIAEEKKNINKIQAQAREQVRTEMPSSVPLELPKAQSDSAIMEKLREQARLKTAQLAPDRIYLQDKDTQLAPDRIYLQDKDSQLAPDRIYLQDKESQLAPDRIYLQDKDTQLAPDRIYLQDKDSQLALDRYYLQYKDSQLAPQPSASVTGAYFNDKGVLDTFNRNAEGEGSSGAKFDKPKSTLEKIGDAFTRYNDPERYLGVDLAAWGLAAPALGALTSSAAPAVASTASNVIQFPTAQVQAAQAIKPATNNILQFPTQAAAGFGLGAIDRQMMQQAKPVQLPTALSGDYSAGTEWNPTTKMTTNKINAKAQATGKANVSGLSSPSSGSTGENNSALNNLVKNISNSLAGLKR